ncbi:hypothetical protein EUX98_g8089 [Antrodiella citrinella]|uniref:Phosphatidylinositol-specific phospholipase C X domain-containing protein n=1 Tax=Antrodiella citrinella TaxID=2447956 RepID=A0A4S4MIU2_9APHY|nr:hypothetical protein EUX98_g8089 [Antrodiella citrinella]
MNISRLLTQAVLSLAFFTSTSLLAHAAHVQRRATVCNGHAELCDRGYGNVTFVGAHNSYAVGTNNLFTNQDYDVTQQLTDGIRMLQMQAHNSSGDIHLCHTACSLQDGGLLSDYLGKVSTWMGANPNEVVTLLIVNSDNLPATQFDAAFKSAGLDTMSFAPASAALPQSGWPTLGSLIDSGKPLVSFLTTTADFNSVPYLIDEFTNIWETAFDVTDTTFDCNVNRSNGNPDTQMFLINHFLDSPVAGIAALPAPDKSAANVTNAVSGVGSLGQQVDTCIDAHGRDPNFMLVDFYEFGGGSVFSVAATANGVTYAPTTPIATPIPDGGSSSNSSSGQSSSGLRIATGTSFTVVTAMLLGHNQPVGPTPTIVQGFQLESISNGVKKGPYGSGDIDDGYTLVFETMDAFQEWRRAEEEEKTVEFVKGDTHGSKAVPPRFKDHTKLVCARHSRSGRKKYVKKYPERVRKVPSRKIEGLGCPASISYKTYFDSDEVRACYVSEHSHEIGMANLPFTKKGRKAQAEQARARGLPSIAASEDTDQSVTPPAMAAHMNAVAGPSNIVPRMTASPVAHTPMQMPTPTRPSTTQLQHPQFQHAVSMAAPIPPPQPTHVDMSQERWDRMSVLFQNIRAHARGFEYPGGSVAALESVLIRLYLESPVVGVDGSTHGGSGLNMGGILEKHKDYVLRAQDYHSKRDRLTRLKQKAAERNKDEFYFSMHKQRTEKGVHVQDRGNESLPIDFVKILKSQDENYIRTTRLAGLKKIDRIKGNLSTIADLLGSASLDGDEDGQENGLEESEVEILRSAGIIAEPTSTQGRSKSVRRKTKHILFAESDEQVQQLATTSRTSISDVPVKSSAPEPGPFDLGWKVVDSDKKGKRKSATSEAGVDSSGKVQQQQAEAREHRSQLLKELSARLNRDQQLRYAERELEMQKLLMGKGGSRKLAGVEKVEDEDEGDEGRSLRKKVDEKTWKPRVYKWRLERKR